jgi:2,4-dienoyl-CoA reductase-like NADH-dependent reductase (Old Yellow Enzyme family)
MIYQLWYAIHGSNGDSIWDMQRRTQHEIKAIDDKLDTFLQNRAATCPVADMMETREEDRRRIINDLVARYYKRVAAIIGIVSLLITAGSLVVAIVSVV